MVATPQTYANVDPFASVADLRPYGEDAAQKLRAVHDELLRHGAAGDAQRLRTINTAAEQRDFGSLERLAIRGHSLDELSEIKHGRVRLVVGWRNVAALLPLLVTWLLLGWASISYHRALTEHPEQSTEPFLALWQGRFGGEVIPTFAETAIAAFVLLTVVLLLTVRAHRLESSSNRVVSDVAANTDEAMSALALCAETGKIRPPVSAEEWARAAQQVLTETQAMIEAAVRDTTALAATNKQISQTAHTAMADLQVQAKELVTSLARETTETMVAVREDNAQFIARTAEEAKLVIQQATAANRQLIEHHMTPLFDGFRVSLNEYRADHEVYRASAVALSGGVAELTKSAATLAASAQSYIEVATSIDAHLKLIESSQSRFVGEVAGHSQSIATAATALREVAELLSGRMRGDLEELARNVVNAGAGLAAIDHRLVGTSTSLEATTRAMRDAADRFAAIGALPPRPGAWQRLVRRLRGGS